MPVRAFTGGLISGGLNSGVGILSSIKDSIFSPQAFNKLLSIGTSFALDKIGLPPIAKDVVSGFISGIGGSDAGKEIFGKLREGAERFGSWISKGAGSMIDFGSRVMEGAGRVTETGFRKAVDLFSGAFSRQTQESIYADATRLKQAKVSERQGVWTWESGDTRIDYDSDSGTLRESFGKDGATARIEGLGKEINSGSYSANTLSYENVMREGRLIQRYEGGKFAGWTYVSNEGEEIGVKGEGEGLDKNGDLIEGKISYNIPGPGPEPDPEENPRDNPEKYDWTNFEIQVKSGKATQSEVAVRGSANKNPISNTTHLDKELYVLVNGIGNDQETMSPGYIRNLQIDLAEQSFMTDQTVHPTRDIVLAPTFLIDSLVEKAMVTLLGQTGAREALQKLKDMWELFGSLQNGGSADLVWDIRKSLHDFGDRQGVESLLRPMVGVGYSGGFIPLVDALASGEYQPKSFVALGGAAISIGAEIAEGLVRFLQEAEKFLSEKITRQSLKDAAKFLGKAIKHPVAKILSEAAKLLVDTLDRFYDAADSTVVEALLNTVSPLLKVWVQEQTGFTWPLSINATGAELVVNVWGSKDPLAGIKVSGYRESIGLYNVQDRNKPLFNIEILGADHFDYIKGVRNYEKDFPDPIKRQEAITRNEIVSQFVAQLILSAETADELQAFLQSSPNGAKVTSTGLNHFIVDFGF